MKPQRRKEGLVVRELPDEVLVYDLQRHRAHCLNPTAGFVFKQCDGHTSVKEIAKRLRQDMAVPADEKWVFLALDRLRKVHLLEKPNGAAGNGPRYSRRELLRRAGVAGAALLPVVISLVAPTAVQAAATCVPPGGCAPSKPFGTPCHCGNPGECQTNCACDGLGSCVDQGGGCTGAPC